MKTVLLIAYYYPPLGGIGSQRSLKFARYLLEFGWQPIVLTPQHGSYVLDPSLDTGEADGVQVIRTPSLDISSLLKSTLPGKEAGSALPVQHEAPDGSALEKPLKSFLRTLARTWLYIPDGQIGWYPYAVRAGRGILATQKVDAIFSTSFPVTSHLVAQRLKRMTGTPWIAEFRDLWTENHYIEYSSVLRKRLDQRTERRILRNVDTLVTVSNTWADTLRRMTRDRKRVEVIRNGFDSNDFKGIEPQPSAKWIITYVGMFYGAKQDPTSFLGVLKRLMERGQIDENDVLFNIVGQPEAYVENLVARLGLEAVTHFTGFVSHRASLQHQANSSLLLLILHRAQSNPGHILGKLYEYLGARRPILALVPPEFEAAQIVREARGGWVAEATDDEAIEKALLESYNAFKSGSKLALGNADLDTYERRAGARQLAKLLEDLSAGPGAPRSNPQQ